MAKGISIGIASDTKEFTQGVKTGVIKPLEDAADTLKEVEKKGDKAGSELEAGFKDAQKATNKFEDELKDAVAGLKEVSRSSRTSTKEVSDDFELSAGQQKKLRKEAIKEIGNEAKQNAAETFSSFDGSAQSFVDGVQGTLGGLVSSLGPVGLALGAAGAAAIGVINGLLAKGVENTDKFKERVGTLTEALIAAGKSSEVPLEQMVNRLKELEGKGDDAGNTLKSLRQAAKDTGIPFSALAKAYAGNTKEIAKYLPKLREMSTRQHSYGDETKFFAESVKNATDKQYTSSQRILEIVGEQRSELRDAAADAQTWAESGIPEMQKRADAIEASSKQADEALAHSTEVRKTHLDAIDTAYDSAGTAVGDFLNKESGVFDLDKWNKSMEERQKSITNYGTNLIKAGFTPDEIAVVDGMGFEAGSAFMESYVKGSAAQKEETKKHLDEMAKETSGSYTQTVDNELARMKEHRVDGPTVVPHVDTTQAERDFQAFLSKRRAEIEVGIRYRNGKPVI